MEGVLNGVYVSICQFVYICLLRVPYLFSVLYFRPLQFKQKLEKLSRWFNHRRSYRKNEKIVRS
jgi:hypothetical protein